MKFLVKICNLNIFMLYVLLWLELSEIIIFKKINVKRLISIVLAVKYLGYN